MSRADKYAAAITALIVAFFTWLLWNFGVDGLVFFLLAVTVFGVVAGVFALVRLVLGELWGGDDDQ